MVITKPPVIKCKKCGKIHKPEIDDFGYPETSSDERNMGYETQYSWELQFSCDKCKNEMTVLIEGWEYPAGVFNYEEFTSEGCSFIEEPQIEITYDDYQDEENI